MRDQWRHEQRERQSADGLASGSATMNPDLALRLDMTRLFEQLRPQQRQLMWLAYVEGYDHREIGAALGLGERSVRVLLHRARRKLAGLLRQRGRGAGETR